MILSEADMQKFANAKEGDTLSNDDVMKTYKASGYFAAIHKGTLLSCTVMGREIGSITF